MRTLWTGAISFGLIHIPIKLYTATESRSLDFDYLRKGDMCKIGYARVCKATGEEVPYDHIVRGFEYQKGDYVVLQDEDFKRASPRKTQIIDITDFVDEDDIDSKYFVKPYYLGPDKGADKVYMLMVEALKRSKKIGIGKFVLRNREKLVALKPENGILILNEMRFEEEIRKPDKEVKPDEVNLSEKEIDMAIALIGQLSDPFESEKYKDTYIDELEEIIEEKAKGELRPAREMNVQPTQVPDLMAALRQSLEAAKEKRVPVESK